jgi:hypothetical protein
LVDCDPGSGFLRDFPRGAFSPCSLPSPSSRGRSALRKGRLRQWAALALRLPRLRSKLLRPPVKGAFGVPFGQPCIWLESDSSAGEWDRRPLRFRAAYETLMYVQTSGAPRFTAPTSHPVIPAIMLRVRMHAIVPYRALCTIMFVAFRNVSLVVTFHEPVQATARSTTMNLLCMKGSRWSN